MVYVLSKQTKNTFNVPLFYHIDKTVVSWWNSEIYWASLLISS